MTLMPSLSPVHPFVRPQSAPVSTQQPAKPISAIRFSSLPQDRMSRTVPISGERIPDHIYRLLQAAPKNELHIHQGGSSGLSFLNYALRCEIDRNAIDALPLYPTKGPDTPSVTPEMVRFKDEQGNPLLPEARRAAMEKVLTRDNLQEYFRYQAELDNQKSYMSSQDLAETTAKGGTQTQANRERIRATALDHLRKIGLNPYRQTSYEINKRVKNPPAAYKTAYDYSMSLALEHVPYTEYRVSPLGNGIGGNYKSGIEDVLSSVNDGFKDARDDLQQRHYNFDYGLLVLFERQSRPGEAPESKVTKAIQLAHDVVRLKKEGKYNIAGVDLAGDEANNPVTEFKEVFDIINTYNADPKTKLEDRLGITIHAGETPTSSNPAKGIDLKGWQSIDKAIDVASNPKAKYPSMVRIGHGLQIIDSSQALKDAFQIYLDNPKDWEKRIRLKELKASSPLLQKVINQNVVLEMCPKSNLQTYGIYPGFPDTPNINDTSLYTAQAYRRHPAVFLSRLGVKVALSSDNRTISNTDITNEFVKLFKYAGLTYTDFKKMVMNGFEGAFIADPVKKNRIISDARTQFRNIERNPEFIKAIRDMRGKLSLFQRLVLWRKNVMDWFYQKVDALSDMLSQWRQQASNTNQLHPLPWLRH
jgi:adenosine deaminase